MGGGTSIVGLGCPGSNDPGDRLAGSPLAGPPGAESDGDVDPGPTQAAIDHARARTKVSRSTVCMSA
jgi:hypothetical protein